MSMTLISSQTLGSSAASVTFSNIPQTFKTLKLVVSSKRDIASGTGVADINFNGSSANLSTRHIEANGSVAQSGSGTAGMYGQAGENAEAGWSSSEITIPNYSAGSSYRSFSSESVREANATNTFMNLVAGLWSSTAAVTSITLKPENASSNWIAGSSFYLYGLS